MAKACTNRSRRIPALSGVGVVALAIASSARAWSSPADPPASQPAPEPGILAGPTVEEEATTTTTGAMRPNAQRDQTRSGIPYQRWLRILNSLELAEEQRSTIDVMVAEFEKARADYNAEHDVELDAIRARQREARAQGLPVKREDARKLREIEQGAPKPTDAQQQIWEQLTQDQQDAFRRRLERVRADMERSRPGNDRPAQAGTDPMNNPPMLDEAAADAGDDMTGDHDSANTLDRAGRDTLAQRRWKFLMSRQSSSRPGADAAANDRRFEFDGDGAAGGASAPPATQPDAGAGR